MIRIRLFVIVGGVGRGRFESGGGVSEELLIR